MNPPEFYCTKYETTFTVIFDKLYELNEEVDEWVQVDWDIIGEDDEKNDHYAWVYGKLKREISDAIKNDPFTKLF